MPGGLLYDDPKGYNKKRKGVLPAQLPLVGMLLLFCTTALFYWKHASSSSQLAKLQETLTVTKMQADQYRQEVDRSTVTVSSRDRTIADLQRRVDQVKKELEGERKASSMERGETQRCRSEFATVSSRVATLEAELVAERQRAATASSGDSLYLKQQLDAANLDASASKAREADCDRTLQDERLRAANRERDLLTQVSTLAGNVQKLNQELQALPCRTANAASDGQQAAANAGRILQDAQGTAGAGSASTYIPTTTTQQQQAYPPPQVPYNPTTTQPTYPTPQQQAYPTLVQQQQQYVNPVPQHQTYPTPVQQGSTVSAQQQNAAGHPRLSNYVVQGGAHAGGGPQPVQQQGGTPPATGNEKPLAGEAPASGQGQQFHNYMPNDVWLDEDYHDYLHSYDWSEYKDNAGGAQQGQQQHQQQHNQQHQQQQHGQQQAAA